MYCKWTDVITGDCERTPNKKMLARPNNTNSCQAFGTRAVRTSLTLLSIPRLATRRGRGHDGQQRYPLGRSLHALGVLARKMPWLDRY